MLLTRTERAIAVDSLLHMHARATADWQRYLLRPRLQPPTGARQAQPTIFNQLATNPGWLRGSGMAGSTPRTAESDEPADRSRAVTQQH